jgi:hypothetical protein
VPFRWLRAEAEAGRIPCLRADKQFLCDFAAVEAALLERARQGANHEQTTDRPLGLPEKAKVEIDGVEFRGLSTEKGALSIVPPSGGRAWLAGLSLDDLEPAELPLAIADWEAIEIDKEGWRIVDDPPIRFRRTKGMLPLPYPEGGGSIKELLRPFVNTTFDGWVLLLAWMMAAMRPSHSYPILPCIEPDKRRSKAEFQTAFDAARPRILGALLDAVVVALQRLPEVRQRRREWPRTADFAQFASAAEPALGLAPGTFMQAYLDNRETANQTALESSPVVAALMAMLQRSGGTFQGTATQLREAISLGQDTRAKSWPKNARALSGLLERLAPNLRQSGLIVEHGRDGNGKVWRIEMLSSSPMYASLQSTQKWQQDIQAQ